MRGRGSRASRRSRRGRFFRLVSRRLVVVVAAAGLDLKHPGGKEYLILGAGALVAGLVFFSLRRNTGQGDGSSDSGGGGLGGGGGLFGGGTRGTTAVIPNSGVTSSPGMPPVFLAPSQSPNGVGGSTPTGNIFSDLAAGRGHRPVNAGFRQPSTSDTGQNPLTAVSSPPALNAGITGPIGAASSGLTAFFNALIAKGLTPVQAAGIAGNAQNESSFSSQAVGDAGTSFGLVQWHLGGAGGNWANQLVTGNPAQDFAQQVNSIVNTFKKGGFTGTTPQQIASKWASQFEG